MLSKGKILLVLVLVLLAVFPAHSKSCNGFFHKPQILTSLNVKMSEEFELNIWLPTYAKDLESLFRDVYFNFMFAGEQGFYVAEEKNPGPYARTPLKAKSGLVSAADYRDVSQYYHVYINGKLAEDLNFRKRSLKDHKGSELYTAFVIKNELRRAHPFSVRQKYQTKGQLTDQQIEVLLNDTVEKIRGERPKNVTWSPSYRVAKVRKQLQLRHLEKKTGQAQEVGFILVDEISVFRGNNEETVGFQVELELSKLYFERLNDYIAIDQFKSELEVTLGGQEILSNTVELVASYLQAGK